MGLSREIANWWPIVAGGGAICMALSLPVEGSRNYMISEGAVAVSTTTSQIASGKKLIYFPHVVNNPFNFDRRFGVVGRQDRYRIGMNWYTYIYNNGGSLQQVGRDFEDESKLDDFIRSYRGLSYIVCTEPNVPGQCDIPPASYAQMLYDYSTRIKGIDKTAKIYGMNIANYPNNDKAIAYLQAVDDAYFLKFNKYPDYDVLAFHPYSYPERPCSTQEALEFIDKIILYKYTHPHMARKPLSVLEFGPLLDSCSEDYIDILVNYMLSKPDIQDWYYFGEDPSFIAPPGSTPYGGALFTDTGDLTKFGKRYQELMFRESQANPLKATKK